MIYGDMEFHLETNCAILVRYNGYSDKVYLPRFVEDLPVTQIGPNAFRNKRIRELYLPELITKIGEDAFHGCNDLSFICSDDYANKEYQTSSLGAQLRFVGDRAFSETGITDLSLQSTSLSLGERVFAGCKTLRTVCLPYCIDLVLGKEVFINSAIQDFVCPQASCSRLPEGTFADCPRLRDHQLMVSGFGKDAFLNCTSLQYLDLEGLQRLDVPVFSGCVKLKELMLPASLTYCTADAFLGSSLEHLDISGENLNYRCHKGLLYDMQLRTLIACPPGRTDPVILPPTVHCIGTRAFYSSSVNAVSMANVTWIGEEAFFDASTRLVDLPLRLEHLGEDAFSCCRQLQVAILPDTLDIDYEKHFSSSPITTIFYRGDPLSYNARVSGRLINEDVSLYLLDPEGNYYEACQVKRSPLFTFLEYGRHVKILEISGYLSHVDVPETINGKPVTSLATGAVSERIQVLFLPDTVTFIEKDAFSKATGLRFLSLPANTDLWNDPIPKTCKTVYRNNSPD